MSSSSSSSKPGMLQLDAVIGYAGGVSSGLLLHHDDKRIMYPLGSNIVVKDLITQTQSFLMRDGHDRDVSCLALSHSGRFVASGQITHMGFPAVVLVWELDTATVVHRFSLHKGKVQSLAFSCDDKWLATLGGEDDNKLVIWNMESGDPVCGNPASSDAALAVKFVNNNPFKLVTAGKYNLRVWQYDLPNRKIRPTDCSLGSLKRVANCIAIDKNDKFLYVGTASGDILRINLDVHLFKDSGPRKGLFSNGIRVIALTPDDQVLVGAGDGTVALLSSNKFQIMKQVKLDGAISSIVLNKATDHFFVGTMTCDIHLVHVSSFDHEIRASCHSSRINDVCFANGFSELFVTASQRDITVWNMAKRTELLRIHMHNIECMCVTLTNDGKAIVSGWSDGKVRAFKPQSGTLAYVIHDAHKDAVTAIAVTNDATRVISGGSDGRVRVWSIGAMCTTRMMASLSEHKGRVTCIRVKGDDSECVSASNDGSCIVWDLVNYLRVTALFASTQFSTIVYHPDESQLLTAGTDRKITYWDAVDGNAIRIVDGSNSGEISSLDISGDGELFVSSSTDKLVKVWGYDEGHCYYYGIGHSGAIKRVVISHDQKKAVSVGNEGAVFIWNMPNHIDIRNPDKPIGESEAATSDIDDVSTKLLDQHIDESEAEKSGENSLLRAEH